jgi:hypothetical protein
MNERIRELAVQARQEFLKMPTGYTPEQVGMYPQLMEKFAQLIVAECLGIVDDAERGGSNEIWDNAVKFIRRDLQEHFGVES